MGNQSVKGVCLPGMFEVINVSEGSVVTGGCETGVSRL